MKSWINILGSKASLKSEKLVTFCCHGLETDWAEIKIFLYKPMLHNSFTLSSEVFCYWKKWLCLLPSSKNSCGQKCQEKKWISQIEGHIITKSEDALQLCFYETFWVCLWKFWDIGFFMILINRQTFLTIWISKESQIIHKQNKLPDSRNWFP